MELSPQKEEKYQNFEINRPKRAKWYTMEVPFSPKKDDTEVEEPILLLQHFSPAPYICFNKVQVGSSKTCHLRVRNPHKEPRTVHVEKFPFEKGFSIASQNFEVNAGCEIKIDITWTPVRVISCREVVMFRTSDCSKTQAFLLGNSISPAKKKKNQRRKWSPHVETSHKKPALFCSNSPNDKENNLNSNHLNGSAFHSMDKAQCIDQIDRTNNGDVLPLILNVKKFDNVFPESPIRRQTYIINQMLRNSGAYGPWSHLSSSTHQEKERLSDIPVDTVAHGCIDVATPKTYMKEAAKEPDSFNDSLEDSSEKQLGVMFKNLADKPASPGCQATFTKEVKSDVTHALRDKFRDKSETYKLDEIVASVPHTHQYLPVINTFEPIVDSCQQFHEDSLIQNVFAESKNADIDLVMSSKDAAPLRISFTDTENPPKLYVFTGDKENPKSDSSDDMVSPQKKLFDDTVIEDNSVLPGKFPGKLQKCSTQIMSDLPEFTLSSDLSPVQNIHQKPDGKLTGVRKCGSAPRNQYSPGKNDVSKATEKKPTKPHMAPPRKSFSVGSRAALKDDQMPFLNKKRKAQKQNFKTPVCSVAKKSSFSTSQVDKTRRKTGLPKETDGLDQKKNQDKTTRQSDRSLLSSCRNSFLVPKKLNLVKPQKVEATRHPNPFSAMNMYYDERWLEKQEVGFTSWLNFILAPPDELKTSNEGAQVDAGKLWIESMKESHVVRAPTKDDVSLKAYTAVRRLNRLRRASCRLYQSEQVTSVIKRLEVEIEMKRIVIRKDRATHADFGIKKNILSLLMNYNILWLRIGLETVYGEIIPMQSNQDVVGLSRFIVQRFLANPDIAAKFAHPLVTNFFKPGYEDEIKKFTLKKFLLLVYFLDVAKQVRLIDHNPCLFHKNSEYKASRDLLLAFSRDYLSGEGDVTRHLKYYGYVVCHRQTYLEEFDYAVTNIAVDLRCGLRLVRVMELLLHDWTLSDSLRVPVISRLQKIHNNDVVLKAFANAGYRIEGDINARDLADGHREKTLHLLWQIIFKMQIEKLLDKKKIKEEIIYLKRNLEHKAEAAAFNAIRLPVSSSEAEAFKSSLVTSDLYEENECLRMLLEWCQAVCGHYGLKVYNFTSSFSDGRAFCFLVHHYHPTVLPLSSVKQETTCRYFEEREYDDDSSDSEINEPNILLHRPGKTHAVDMEKLLKNERENIKLAFEKFQEIGGVPIMSRPTDISNTIPDEKIIITLTSYLNIRLMDLSREIRAARVLQLAWRKRQLHKRRARLQKEISAIIVIQRAVRRFLQKRRFQRMNKAAVVIQTQWRMLKAKRKLAALKEQKHMEFLSSKAVIIQAAYRGYKSRKAMKLKTQAAVVIQSHIRRYIARCRYLAFRQHVINLQHRYRAKVLSIKERSKYLSIRNSTIILQSNIRCVLACRKFQRMRCAAIRIQSCIRMWLAQSKYEQLRSAAIKIQQLFRAKLAMEKCRCQYEKLKSAVTTISRWYKKCVENRRRHNAAVIIQSCAKQYFARKKYLKMRDAVVCIQQRWKAYILKNRDREFYLLKRKSVVTIQAYVRKFIVQKAYCKQKHSAVIIQKYVRCWLAISLVKKQKQSIIAIQTWWRAVIFGKRIRDNYIQLKCSAIKLQAWIRMLHHRQYFLLLKATVRVIECRWVAKCNAVAVRTEFLKLKKATLILQAAGRGYLCRKQINIQRRSAAVIQAAVRGYLSRKSYVMQKRAAVTIQKYYRSYKKMQHCKENFNKMKCGFIALQALYHGRKVRASLEQWNKCATIVQKNYRMYILRKRFRYMKQAAVAIQRRFRANLAMKKQFESYTLIRKSTLLIQSACRGYLVRSRVKRIKAAIVIQSAFKMYVSRKNFLLKKAATVKVQAVFRMIIARRKYVEALEKIIFIQRRYRDYCVSKFYRGQFLEMKKATVVIQSHYRGLVARRQMKMIKSAIFIQSTFRMFKERKSYFLKKCAAVKIQAFTRMAITRKAYIEYRNNVLYVQNRYRLKRKGRLQRQEFLKLRTSCIFLQSLYRGHRARQEVKWIKAAIKVQSTFRMYVIRKQFLAKRQAAIKIQSYMRSVIARNKYHQLYNAVLLVQRMYKRKLEAVKYRAEFLRKRNSCVVLQSHFRCLLARRNYLRTKKVCIYVQSIFRMKLVQKDYLKLKQSAMLIQCRYHGVLEMKKLRKDFLEKRYACTVIQAGFRGWKQRQQYKADLQKITLVQSVVRGFLVRKSYQKQRRHVIILQRLWRLAIVKKQESKRREAAALIVQKNFRGYLQRCRYQKQVYLICKLQNCVRAILSRRKYEEMQSRHRAAVVIQKRWRIILAKRQQQIAKEKREMVLQQIAEVTYLNLQAIRIQRYYRKFRLIKAAETKLHSILIIQNWFRAVLQRLWFLRLRKNVTAFQAAARCYLQKRTNAAICIQSYVRSWLVCQELQRKHSAAIKIQSAWRAYHIRSMNGTEVVLAREKIRTVTDHATEHQKLGNRTKYALEYLLKDRISLNYILHALAELDISTGMSPVCCMQIVLAGGMDVIISLINKCNRSVPHMEIIKYSINILLNLCKYQNTVNYVWVAENSIETILEMMRIFKDKGTTIFTKCCSLLWILSRDPHKAQQMREDSHVTGSICSLHYLVMRKKKIEDKRREMQTKAKMMESFSTSFLSRTCYQRPSAKKHMNIQPDWVLGDNVMREFTDPVAAINALMKELNLKPK